MTRRAFQSLILDQDELSASSFGRFTLVSSGHGPVISPGPDQNRLGGHETCACLCGTLSHPPVNPPTQLSGLIWATVTMGGRAASEYPVTPAWSIALPPPPVLARSKSIRSSCVLILLLFRVPRENCTLGQNTEHSFLQVRHGAYNFMTFCS
jgi:hypothetical protein